MSITKRSYCRQCQYPELTCVCDAIVNIVLPINVIVLQHKKEVLHAKNTIRLACLVSPAIRVISTEFTDEISYTIANLDTKYTLILYPSPESTAIENVRDAHSEIKTIILLDGSWKQAYSIWQSFPTLRTFTAVHFDSPPLKQYGIRKSKKTYQLSSIEALSYSVSTLTNIDTSAYAIALAKMKHHWHNIKNERAE